MTLSSEQSRAIADGQAVALVIDGTRCVVVRQDVFEHCTAKGEASPRQTYASVLKVLDQSDELPEQYLEYLAQ